MNALTASVVVYDIFTDGLKILNRCINTYMFLIFPVLLTLPYRICPVLS